jgi:calcineurin-like phosphoesterase family protein
LISQHVTALRRTIWPAVMTIVATLGAALTPTAAAAAPVLTAALATSSDPVLAAAGDIACDPSSSSYNGGAGTSNACRQRSVSDLLTAMNPDAVVALGDNQYYCGGLSAFQQVYDPTWGRVKAVTHPVVGNHEYLTSGGTGCNSTNAGAAGYFDYFGSAAGQRGQGWYSLDVGAWHLIAINSNCSNAGGCGATSAQGQWLAADLAAHHNLCTMAFWHIPLFSSGGRAASNTASIWSQLYNAGADFVLTGHDHIYERFARQTSTGVRDDRTGIREFVVGTGGANHTTLVSTATNSEVRDASTFGVIKMTLHPDSVDWQFVHEGSAGFTDTGSEFCHGAPTDTTAPSQPTGLTGNAVSPGQVNLSWTASTDATGVAQYLIKRDGAQIGTSKTTSFSDTTAIAGTSPAYTVTAVDYNSYSSTPSAPVTINVPNDVTPPTVPTGLYTTSVQADTVALAWTPSTDDAAVASYRIYRGGVRVGSSAVPSFSDTTVAPTTTYTYTVSAVDRSSNESGQSTPPLPVTTPARPTTITLNPVADAYVQADQASTSFGTAATLVADASPVRRTLVKFTVSGVAGRPVLRAVLRLWCVDPSGTGGSLHGVPNTTWTESVTWNSAPAGNSTTVASIGSVSAGAWYEWDVTALVTSDGTVSMDLTSTDSNGAYYASREGTAAQRPQLVITTAP